MPRREIEGDWVMGWPDRKRPKLIEAKDREGRVILGRTPLRDLEGLITPIDCYYVVAQLDVPEPIHPDDWRLTIKGRVERPFEIGFEELRALPSRTVRAVTECAGNDADFFSYLAGKRPKPRWFDERGFDAVANELADKGRPGDKSRVLEVDIPSSGYLSAGEFTGTPLREVLERAGIEPGSVSVRLEGFDRGRPDPLVQYLSAGRTDIEIVDPGVIHYDKALPLEKALDPDTIIAWAQNGEYLMHLHGAPARLVVPGWSGNWWVKWLGEIEVLDHMPACYYQTHYFVLADSPESPQREMCTALGVKSVITDPQDDDSPLPAGARVIRGLAWSGMGAITRVEVSTDGGDTWQDAEIEEPREKWLWVRWRRAWHPSKPGRYVLKARATDEAGRTQPVIPWNYQRKHFDGIVPVEVDVR